MAAEKPAVKNTPPVAPQASSAGPSGTYEDRRGLGGRPGGRPRGAVGRQGARVADTPCGLWLLGRAIMVRAAAAESSAARPNSQFLCFLEPPITGYAYREPSESLGPFSRHPRQSGLPRLRRDQDRSSAAADPYSLLACIKVLF